jgi:hypothetical protein
MVFRTVLDHVDIKYYLNKIFIAHANKFGKSKREEIVAKLYLEKICLNVIAPKIYEKSYIDTLGNAIFLAKYLKLNNSWPLKNAILIVAKQHYKRVVLCFTSQGFRFEKVDIIPYKIRKDDMVVKRLFYYKYPNIHKMYECFAYIRDVKRIYLMRRFKCHCI